MNNLSEDEAQGYACAKTKQIAHGAPSLANMVLMQRDVLQAHIQLAYLDGGIAAMRDLHAQNQPQLKGEI